MRRWRRAIFVAIASASAACGFASGCQDATQATLEIQMLKRELCSKSGGTAIAVGSDRDETEARIATYVTAETRDCDVATGTIGSLVITPGESGRAAIVVAVAFDTSRARTASDCKPPAYAGCIVSRRFVAFSSHRNVRLPITIDPDCLDVPCNAVSTCRKGNCYDSTTVNGEEPGDDGKGGALEGGIVDGSADGFTPDGARSDGSTSDGGDGATGDSSGGDGGETGSDASGSIPFCGTEVKPTLYCQSGPAACNVGQSCCTPSGGGSPFCGACMAGSEARCCTSDDCPASLCCPAPGADPSIPRVCGPGGVSADGGFMLKPGCAF